MPICNQAFPLTSRLLHPAANSPSAFDASQTSRPQLVQNQACGFPPSAPVLLPRSYLYPDKWHPLYLKAQARCLGAMQDTFLSLRLYIQLSLSLVCFTSYISWDPVHSSLLPPLLIQSKAPVHSPGRLLQLADCSLCLPILSVLFQ